MIKQRVILFLVILVVGIFLVGEVNATTTNQLISSAANFNYIVGNAGSQCFDIGMAVNSFYLYTFVNQSDSTSGPLYHSGFYVALYNSTWGRIGDSTKGYYTGDFSGTLDLGTISSLNVGYVCLSTSAYRYYNNAWRSDSSIGFPFTLTVNGFGAVVPTCAEKYPITPPCGTYPNCRACTCADPPTNNCGTIGSCHTCSYGACSTPPNGGSYSVAPNTGLCSVGTNSAVSELFHSVNGAVHLDGWTWNCTSTDSTASCSANYVSPACVDNGACTAAGTCVGSTCTTNCGVSISGTKTCGAPVTLSYVDGDNYYEIHNCTELQNMSANLTANYELANDINCINTSNPSSVLWHSGAGFMPIGGETSQIVFNGNFKGNGFTISNLYINRSTRVYSGLFGFTNRSNISDVGLVNVNITSYGQVGSLVGYQAWGIIERSYSTGTLEGLVYVGGLVGVQAGGIINNSYSRAVITNSISMSSSELYPFGGLVAMQQPGSIYNSYSTGKINVTFESINLQALGIYFNGGLLGGPISSSVASSSYWDMNTSNRTVSAAGTGRNTTQMQTQSTFSGWNFTNIWGINSSINDGYPFLRVQGLTYVPSLSSSMNWTDLKGASINKIDKEDSVILFFGNENRNVEVNYMINKTGLATAVLSGTTNKGFAVWKANELGNYTFSITKDNWVTRAISGPLNVTNVTNNALAVIDSIIPVNGKRFSVGQLIWFNQSSSDEDDLLNLLWNFKDGNTKSIDNYSSFENSLNSSFGSIQYNYSVAGNYLVELTAKESEREQEAVKFANIHILQTGVNVVPVITTPTNGEVYISANDLYVTFNASQTYVVNCTLCTTGCSGERDNGFYSEDGKLNCTYMHTPGTRINSNLLDHSLFFNWTTGDGVSYSGYWNETNYYGSVEFVHRYANPGRYTASLAVSYQGGIV